MFLVPDNKVHEVRDATKYLSIDALYYASVVHHTVQATSPQRAVASRGARLVWRGLTDNWSDVWRVCTGTNVFFGI